ncbi:DNA-3-methyladenine glycosylase family protein [Vibrio sp.]|uniref:DNA-3-methyladenine glycosylase family protein n=1 Tax=Vibrio sp. TaxID=678 RepID=UPI003D123083
MSVEVHQQLLEQCQAFPTLCRMLRQNGVMSLAGQPPGQLLAYLSRAVAGQQLSTTAARTIWSRVEQASQPFGGLEAFLLEPNYQLLRQCGLSNAKVKTLLGVNQALQTGLISSDIFTSDDIDFIRQQLVQLWGIGQWTAEMALIFFFAKPDVWSAGDAALSRGLALLAETESASGEQILAAATPYRSYLALHVWAMLDAELLSQA